MNVDCKRRNYEIIRQNSTSFLFVRGGLPDTGNRRIYHRGVPFLNINPEMVIYRKAITMVQIFKSVWAGNVLLICNITAGVQEVFP